MERHPRVCVALLAGGMGSRMDVGLPKPFRTLAGRPLIMHSLMAFDAMEEIETIRVAIPAECLDAWDLIVDSFSPKKYRGRVAGGVTRQASALSVLDALEEDGPEVVLVHDAARPIVLREDVRALLRALSSADGAILGNRSVDTIWSVSGEHLLDDVVDRSKVVMARTPQAFPYAVLKKAYEAGIKEGFEGTDDASYVRRAGGRVVWVSGTTKNLKVTFPGDFTLLEALIVGPG